MWVAFDVDSLLLAGKIALNGFGACKKNDDME